MIVDDIDDVLPELREQAESMMTLTVQAYEPGFGPDAEGIKVPMGVPYGDPCCAKVQGSSASARDVAMRFVNIGGIERPLIEGGLHLPVHAYVTDGVLPIKASDSRGIGWEFQVIAVGPDDDCALLNRRYLVWKVPAKSRATARRLDVVEL